MIEHATLSVLNEEYIRCVQDGDVAGFERIMAPEFFCSNPDGTLVERAGFLAQSARPVTIRGLVARDVLIRVFGDTAIIHARTEYATATGEPRQGRYTDVWTRNGARWRAVAAHVTR